MRYFLLLALLLFQGVSSWAQTALTRWATAMGGTTPDAGHALCTDASGNIYCTGYFSGTADFDPSAGEWLLSAKTTINAFVTKSDPDGRLIWARQIEGLSSGTAIQADNKGNVYIAGSFFGTADFDPGTDSLILTANGESDVFLCKLDAAGTLLWAGNMGGTGEERAMAMVTDGNSNVYLTGDFNSPGDFDPGPGEYLIGSTGGTDIFMICVRQNGELSWAGNIGGRADDNAKDIALDTSLGMLYLTGSFSSVANFNLGTGSLLLTAGGGSDIFIAALDTSGRVSWAKQIGGRQNEWGQSICTDSKGHIYITGQFQGTLDFDPGKAIKELKTPDDRSSVFILSISAGGEYTWARNITGDAPVYGLSVAMTGDGVLHIAGTFSGKVDIDPGPLVVALETKKTSASFFLCMTTTAYFEAAGYMEDVYNTDIAPFGSDVLYAAGYFSNACDFDMEHKELILNSKGDDDIYLLRLEFPFVSSIPVIPQSGVLLYPNPAQGVYTVKAGVAWEGAQVTVTDLFGRQTDQFIYSGPVTSRPALPGTYHITFSNATGRVVQQLLVR